MPRHAVLSVEGERRRVDMGWGRGGDGALNTAGIVWDGQGRSWGRGWRTEYSRHCVGWARQKLGEGMAY